MACIVADSGRRWDGPIVPFTIDANLTNPQRVLAAIAAWETVAGVRFVARDNESDYVHFRHGQTVCNSDLGRKGGEQFVTLLPNCSVGTVIHELGHTLGLEHEHQRPDRDGFVTLTIGNVSPGREHDFEKLNASDVVTTSTYEFQSIMHYNSTTASKDGILHTLDGPPGQVLDGSTSPTPLDAQFVAESYQFFVGVVRRSDSGVDAARAVGDIAVASIFPDSFITAVQTGAGTLMLILWSMDPFGGITRLSDSGDQADAASHIAIAGVGGRIVTAVRNGSGNLKLIGWDLANNQIQRFPPPFDDGIVEPGEASLIQILALTPAAPAPLFLTAHRSGSDRLKLITWRLNLDNSFTRLLDSGDQADEVGEISLTQFVPPLGRTALVATTVQTESGTAKVIAWLILIEGPEGEIGSIMRSGDVEEPGKATLIASAFNENIPANNPPGRLVVSFRTGINSGNLKLVTFDVSDTGAVTRVKDSGNQAGAIGLNTLVARHNGMFSSAVSTASGNLKLISWRVELDGTITRTGDSSDQAGGVGMIVLGTSPNQNAPLLTAVQREDGNLAVISWDDNSAHGE